MAVHTRHNSSFISLPSSAKQQPEMIKLFGEREPRRLIFYFEFIDVSQVQFREGFDSDKLSK